MNDTDDLEPDLRTWSVVFNSPIVLHTLNEGTYRVTNPDGSTGTITVPPGASMTIWTQATIERV